MAKKDATRTAQRNSGVPLPSPTLKRRFGERLLAWYQANRRTLPWREAPTPYAVWISESMLQQTQVDTVIPYFLRFMDRFPDLHALSSAREDDVLSAWQGLGYYSRARALHRAAKTLTDSGRHSLPDQVDELLALPGIGPYTARAVASIAFGRDEAVVDGNVVRVLSRVFALSGNPTRAPLRDHFWELATQLLVRGRASDFNQAMMELGALVCRPAQPHCSTCPLKRDCRAYLEGEPTRFPTPVARTPTQHVEVAAAVCRRGKGLLLVQASASAPRWSSMWLLPQVDVAEGETGAQAAQRAVLEQCGLTAVAQRELGRLKHSVTRYRISLQWHELTRLSGRLRARDGCNARFVPEQEIAGLAMPAPHRRICDALKAPPLLLSVHQT